MAFDLKSVIGTIAPTLASMLGGPMAGVAVGALTTALGLGPAAGIDGITKVVTAGAMTADQIGAIRAADQKHAEIIAQQGIDLQKMNAAHEEALGAMTVADVSDARKNLGDKGEIWPVAYVVLLSFAAAMSLVLWGCWNLISGGLKIADQSLAVAIAGLVGSIVGYFAANAQTVINFIFGGSIGARKSADALASSAAQSITALGASSK